MLNHGAELLHYVLEYNAMNENGTEDFGGTENRLVLTDFTEDRITLLELSPGSVYSARMKVVHIQQSWLIMFLQVKTTHGESEFSSNLLFMTLFDSDDIGTARGQIMGESFLKILNSLESVQLRSAR